MTIRTILINTILFISVITIGIFGVNQTLTYIYNSQFLQTPCSLCVELNPHFEECFQDAMTIVTPIEGKQNYEVNLTEFGDLIVQDSP